MNRFLISGGNAHMPVDFSDGGTLRNLGEGTVHYSDDPDQPATASLTTGQSASLSGVHYLWVDLGSNATVTVIIAPPGESGLAARVDVLEALPRASFTGAVDFSDVAEADDFVTKRDLHITSVSNGTNGVRGDSILSDQSNLGGAGLASFVAPDFITVTAADRGSYHGYTAVVILDEIPGDPNVYAEAGALLGQVHSSRKGAYLAGAELGVLIYEGFPGRANGASIGVLEQNTLAEYAASGMSAQWLDTGARGLWLWNLATGGAPYEKPGTGILVEGDWERAAIYARPVDLGGKVLLVGQVGRTDDSFSINGLGTLRWGLFDGTSVAQLAHTGVGGGMQLTGSLTITNDLTVTDDVNITDALNVGGITTANDINVTDALAVGGALFQVGIASFVEPIQIFSAANLVATANAGAATLPANPVGFIRFYNDSGVIVKVPYYAN